MFDLRTALVAEIIDSNLSYIGADCFDARSTEFALNNMKSYSFSDAAVFVGDVKQTNLEHFTFGKNVITNEAELLIAVNSTEGKSAIETIINALRLALERNNLGQLDWLRTSLVEIGGYRKNENTGIFYQTCVFEVLAFEATPGSIATQSIILPTVTITDPGAITVNGTTDITIAFTYTQGTYDIVQTYVMAYRTGTQNRGLYQIGGVPTGGSDSVTFEGVKQTDIADSAGTYGYWIRAIIVDSAGVSGTHQISVNITRS